MRTLKITITGKTDGDLDLTLEHVTKLVREGYLSGHDSNESGRFTFDISGEEDADADDEE